MTCSCHTNARHTNARHVNARHTNARNPRRRHDPTGTKGLRDRFEREMVRRFRWLAKEIDRVVIDEDGFNIEGRAVPIISPVVNLDGRFEFIRPKEKVSAFMKWLNVKTQQGILEVAPGTSMEMASRTAWQNLYIDSAYQKGIRDAGSKMTGAGVRVDPSFIDAAFNRPVHAERIGLIHTRAYSDLKNITKKMETQIADRLAQGMAEGKGPIEIARDLKNRVSAIGATRAKMLARTEIIAAHADATLSSYLEAGVLGVEVEAEWLLGAFEHDMAPCPECQALAEGGPYTIEQARGMIPAHPNAVLEGSTLAFYGKCEELVRARYRGPAIVLSVGGGLDGTTIGPNHPVLSARGFIPAAKLREGDYVLYDMRGEGSRSGGHADDYEVPVCEDVFESSLSIGDDSRIARSGSDLHGDRVFCEGEVEAVRPAGSLVIELNVGPLQEISKDLLMGAYPNPPSVAGLAPGELTGELVGLPSSGCVGGSNAGIIADARFVWVRVLHVEILIRFVGWAFDCTTETGLYHNNGFVVKNCRCAWTPRVIHPGDHVLEGAPGEVQRWRAL